MHIPDILPASVAITGYGLTGLTTWACLKRINRLPDPQAQVPKASLLTAAFFVASWIHIPTPIASVHFILNGLVGVLLGWFAFPAILIGLLFQAILFQHGGLSSLGVNALIMGLPSLIAHGLFQVGRLGWRNGAIAHRFTDETAVTDQAAVIPRTARSGEPSDRIQPDASAPSEPRWLLAGLGFSAGALGLGLSVVAFFSIMVTFLPAHLDAAVEKRAIALLCLAHLPVIALEGSFTAMLVLFLQRVKPELLPALPRQRHSPLLPFPPKRPSIQSPASPAVGQAVGPTRGQKTSAWQEGGR
jgi:cobalt/nickel transport system permease protein